jgi:hypothetical protein
VTSVIGFESPLLAVLACLGFSRKNQPSAFSDFCNTICQKRTSGLLQSRPDPVTADKIADLRNMFRDAYTGWLELYKEAA